MKSLLLIPMLFCASMVAQTTFVAAGSNANFVGGGTSGTLTVTTGAHHVKVLSLNENANGTLSISSSLGYSMTCNDTANALSGLQTRTCYVLDTGAGGSDTITYSSTVSGNIGMIAQEYSMGSVPTLHTSGSATGNSATPSVTTSGAASAGDLSVAMFGSSNGALTTPTNYTCRFSAFNNNACGASDFHDGYDLLSLGSGGVQTVSDSNTSGEWTAQMFVFTTGSSSPTGSNLIGPAKVVGPAKVM